MLTHTVRGRWMLMAAGVLVATMAAGGCQTQATPSPTLLVDQSQTTIGLINARPTAYLGRTVTVMGSVKYIYTPRMLLLADATDEEMLVLVDVDSPVPDVSVNDKVQTTGPVSLFGADMSPSAGVELGGQRRMSDQFYNRWRDRPVIVAVQVAPVTLTAP
ncbi:MAG: hypothetical protein ABFD92_06825 [Planctomycetaceae bacterium]|nr:hypothetical protein [Planctomycetaceae bacterium]